MLLQQQQTINSFTFPTLEVLDNQIFNRFWNLSLTKKIKELIQNNLEYQDPYQSTLISDKIETDTKANQKHYMTLITIPDENTKRNNIQTKL
ncbi:7204_t:CDS:2 [Gigaspora margarita]|uniref:7204_t:CDS:1 n=1 Tax=Gigaspora margarita TaxID=4874 RepID=A0ABN7VCE6_GIGMA|nr:7204_t:CDS:2 [Gigaspora margarita]